MKITTHHPALVLAILQAGHEPRVVVPGQEPCEPLAHTKKPTCLAGCHGCPFRKPTSEPTWP